MRCPPLPARQSVSRSVLARPAQSVKLLVGQPAGRCRFAGRSGCSALSCPGLAWLPGQLGADQHASPQSVSLALLVGLLVSVVSVRVLRSLLLSRPVLSCSCCLADWRLTNTPASVSSICHCSCVCQYPFFSFLLSCRALDVRPTNMLYPVLSLCHCSCVCQHLFFSFLPSCCPANQHVISGAVYLPTACVSVKVFFFSLSCCPCLANWTLTNTSALGLSVCRLSVTVCVSAGVCQCPPVSFLPLLLSCRAPAVVYLHCS